MSEQTVRLTVLQLDPSRGAPTFGSLAVAGPGEVLRQVDTTTERLAAAAGAVVREFAPAERLHQMLASVEKTFTAEPPASGVAAVVNVPTALAFVAAWPWAEGVGGLRPADAD